MGGNALSRTSVRLTRKNYERVAARVVARLKALYPGNRVCAIESYRAKADFGDLDVLVESTGYDPYRAAQALGAVEVARNGPVTSVGLVVRPEVPELEGNVFQVDLVRTESQAFEFAMGYFGRADAGNLLGRLYHACGLALRHDGLFYYVRAGEHGEHKLCEIALTRSFDQALAFMGYDPAVFARGFDTAQDVYRYVASSPFFNPGVFLLENRNAKARVRDRKRVMYMQFLKFCEAYPELPAFAFPEDKKAWLARIVEFFPHFQEEYDKAQADLAEQRAVKAKFNGERVSQLTGLQGKELGRLMKRFKESFETPAAMRAFLLSSAVPVIEARVRAAQAAMTP